MCNEGEEKVRNDKLETNADGNRDGDAVAATTQHDMTNSYTHTGTNHRHTQTHTHRHRDIKKLDGGHNKNQRNKLNNMKKKHCTARTPKTSWK